MTFSDTSRKTSVFWNIISIPHEIVEISRIVVIIRKTIHEISRANNSFIVRYSH